MARKNLENVQPIELVLEHDRPMASSLQVAKHFGKQHNNVLRDIEVVKKEVPTEWFALNFEPTEESVVVPASGGIRQDPAFMLTRDGFAYLCMGFTGKQAAEWKVKYIEAFNAMEQRLKDEAQRFRLSPGLQKVIDRITPPPKEAPEVLHQRRIKVLRGLLIQWARIDHIPLEVAELSLNAYLQITSLDALTPEHFENGFMFLQKNMRTLWSKGEPASQEQILMIKQLAEACSQFRYSRDVDPFTSLHPPPLNFPNTEALTRQDAEKVLINLSNYFQEFLRLTLAYSQLNREMKEE